MMKLFLLLAGCFLMLGIACILMLGIENRIIKIQKELSMVHEDIGLNNQVKSQLSNQLKDVTNERNELRLKLLIQAHNYQRFILSQQQQMEMMRKRLKSLGKDF